MTQDIIEMARYIADTFGTRMCDENGDTHGEELYAMSMDDIVESIKLAAAKEREACARIVEVEAMQYAEPVWAYEIVNDIRARGRA